jgi:hypothetical protein
VLLLLAALVFMFAGCEDLALVAIIREIKDPPTIYTRFVSTLGPPGATVYALLSSGTIFFAGCEDGGVYKSTDYGGSWIVVGEFLPGDVNALVTDGTYIYAGVGDGLTSSDFGVYRITLSGDSWEHVGLSYTVEALLINGSYLYAGTRDYGVRRWPFAGGTWSLYGTNLQSGDINCLAYDGTYLWAGASGVGVSGAHRYESGNWAQKNLGALSGGEQVIRLLYHDKLYATGDFDTVITWDGSTWNQHGNTLGVTRNLSLAGRGSYVYAGINNDGVRRCATTGGNWLKFGSASDDLASADVYSLGIIDTTIIAGTWAGPGLYKRYTSGFTTTAWSKAGAGIFSSVVNDVVSDGTSLFAATEKGVFSRSLAGGFWTDFGTGGATGVVHSLLIHNNQLYAAGSDQVNSVSLAGGAWSSFGTGLPATTIRGLYAVGGYIYAGAWGGDVYRVADSGGAWTSWGTQAENGNGCYGFVEHNGVLFKASNNGVYYKALTGSSWSLLPGYTTVMYSLASDGTYLYGGTWDNGVKRVPLSGGSWEDFGTGLPAEKIFALQVDEQNLIAGLENAKTYSAELGTGDWAGFGTGLFDGTTVKALMVNDGTLYLGTDGSGVWQSEVITK